MSQAILFPTSPWYGSGFRPWSKCGFVIKDSSNPWCGSIGVLEASICRSKSRYRTWSKSESWSSYFRYSNSVSKSTFRGEILAYSYSFSRAKE